MFIICFDIKRERKKMISRAADGVIVIMVVLSISCGWARAAMSPVAWESVCNQEQELNHDASPMHPKPCKMSSCGPSGHCVFLAPDTSSSRFKGDPRGKEKVEYCLDGLKTMQGSYGSLWTSGIHLRRILPSAAPPLFLVNCSFLC